jgi:Tol biopolymer transport system component
VIRASGAGTPSQITHSDGANRLPSWSQDGKWIYFTSDRSGEGHIWKVPVEEGLATGEPIQVTRNGGVRAQEGPHGGFLYFGKPDGSGVWRVPIDGGEEVLVLDRDVEFHCWYLAEGGIYFVSAGSIQRFDLETGELTPVLEREGIVTGLTVSPDGQWIAWSEGTGRVETDLMLVENFQ